MTALKHKDGSCEAGERTESPAEGRARKEKMLHARIPESLDREIKRRAGSLGMSVSTIVRNVLLNTFNLVEDIVADGTNVALSITSESSGRPLAPAPGKSRDSAASGDQILGWQEALLNRNAVCERCNAILKIGCKAAIGIRGQAGTGISIICKDCLAKALGHKGKAKAAAR